MALGCGSAAASASRNHLSNSTTGSASRSCSFSGASVSITPTVSAPGLVRAQTILRTVSQPAADHAVTVVLSPLLPFATTIGAGFDRRGVQLGHGLSPP